VQAASFVHGTLHAPTKQRSATPPNIGQSLSDMQEV
jgi:hypothetical protein